jgi:antirestriction protein ArdC
MKSKPKTRRDVHIEITDTIVQAIEAGPGHFTLPWHRSVSVARPRNVATKRLYRGVNVLALWVSADKNGFPSPLWGTYRQWSSVGAQVRRGEKASLVVFYKPFEVTTENENGEPTTESRRFARASFVFNAAQVDGYTEEVPSILSNAAESLPAVDAFITATRADVRHGGDRAYYRPATDHIQMPQRESFIGTTTSTPMESYYATLLHELTHWTAHPSRLARDLKGRFGDASYAMEELIADLGAAFLCADLAIASSPRADHAAYLASWLQVLKDDKRAIFTAASKASEAAEFLAAFSSGATSNAA